MTLVGTSIMFLTIFNFIISIFRLRNHAMRVFFYVSVVFLFFSLSCFFLVNEKKLISSVILAN